MFRFTIRDVLWLTLVVAMGCGWFLAERRMAGLETETRRRMAAEVQISILQSKLRVYDIDTNDP